MHPSGNSRSVKDSLIVLCGTVRSGKDTFFNLLRSTNVTYKRYALADQLKTDLRSWLLDKMAIDVNTVTGPEKELIRPILIAYGCAQRERFPLYWVKRLDMEIAEAFKANSPTLPVITDVRFKNEIQYFKEKYDCLAVEIKREGSPTPPEEELRNHPLLEPYFDYRITWPTVANNSLIELRPYVDRFKTYFGLQ